MVIARTFSKIHGMAGMRVGYAIGQEKTLTAMREHHSASGISVMSFAAAAASLADTAAMQRNQLLNRQARTVTVAAFEKAGYTVAASQANFVMVDVRRDVRPFIEAVRAEGRLHRPSVSAAHQLGAHHRRHAAGDGPRAAGHARRAEDARHIGRRPAAAVDLRLLVLRTARWH